ncbi:SdrD B-like domain-containing protein [Amphibiibacter pelophylacis]|uniref:SdrD B-like domain-containing protein n=1 Tax=Amphibiibacter pelophylacis TaxID=1799477 RepID=A0ACC6P2G8_9BURK
MATILSNLVSNSPELTITRNSDGSFTLTHPYGVERINADGSGTYERNALYVSLPEPDYYKNADGTPRLTPAGTPDYIPQASYAFTAVLRDTDTGMTRNAPQTLKIVATDDLPSVTGNLGGTVASTAANPVLAGQITVQDPDIKDGKAYQNGTRAASGIIGKYGSLNIDADGHWQYTLNKNNAEVKALGPQGVLTDTLAVTAGDGKTQIPITINVRETLPTTVLNGASVTFTEDTPPYAQSGVLTGTDANGGKIVFPVGSQSSEFGTFTLAASGAWTYTLKNDGADVQSLRAGEELTETIQISAGGATANVVVTIAGVNDVPTVTGVRTAVVTENNGSGVVKAEGQIVVTDKDLDESGVTAGTYTGQYGTVVLGADGRWVYTLDQSKPAVTGLNDGARLTDTIVVRTLDGTPVDVVVDINGRSVTAPPPTPTPALGSLSGLVWSDTSGDGIRQTGENGIAAVGVELRNAAGALLASTTTDASGQYSFGNLAAGQYVVDFRESSAALNGLRLVAANQGSDTTRNSDATNTSWNATGVLTLAAGQTLSHIDAGYAPVANAGVSGVLWADTNGDGVHQAGETAGVAGVSAVLRKDSDNSVVATTTTGANGAYSFSGVAAGRYYVDFDAKSPALAGKVFSAATAGDAASNNDVQNAGGETSHFTLGSSQQLAHVDGAVRAVVAAATFVEDAPPYTQSGKLPGTNAAGETLVFPASSAPGDYGTITLKTDGSWSYTLDNTAAAVQSLAEGDEIKEVYTIGEGATATDITITIRGSNDAPVVSGNQAASLSANHGSSAVKAEGTVRVTDADHDQSGVKAGSYTGQYGALALDATGHWVYTLDQSKAAIAALASGQKVTDSVAYQTLDGTRETIAITIEGAKLGVTVAEQSALKTVVGSEDTALTLGWSQFGVGGDGSALGIKVVSLPADGALQLGGSAVTAGTVISRADIDAGKLKFVPDANESGIDAFATPGVGNLKNDYAQFRFAGSDGVTLTAERTLTVDIRPVTDAPVWIAPSAESVLPPAAGTVLYTENLADGQAQGWRSYKSATPATTERTEIAPESAYLGGTGTRPLIEVESDPGVNVLGTTLVTDPGAVYTFSLDYAARKGAETGGDSKLAFYVNGVERGVMDTQSTTLTPFKFTFTGTGSDLLEFRSANANGAGGLVSNFKLVAGSGDLPAPQPVTRLVTSEDFEDGQAQGWTAYKLGTPGTPEAVEIGPQSSYLGGSSTNKVLEVESTAGVNTLGRTFQTVAGADYRISLDYAARQGFENTSKLSVYVNGVEKAVMDTHSASWKNFEVSFKGTGSDLVELRSADANSVGGVVDNIRLYTSDPATAGSALPSSTLTYTGDGTQANPATLSVQGTPPLKVPVGLVGSVDADGSETQKIILKGLEPGYGLADNQGHSYLVPPEGVNLVVYNSRDTTGGNWDLGSLRIIPPADKLGTLHLVFEATSQDVGDAVKTTPYYVNLNWSEVPTSSVSGVVWVDSNEDKVRQAGESGVAGVVAQLRAVNADGSLGAIVATTTTGANGEYSFTQQKSGHYLVDFDESKLPAGARFVPGGDTDIRDTSNSGHTYAFDLTQGQALKNFDAAVKPQGATLSGSVWNDANGDGIRQSGEAGIAGVTVDVRVAGTTNSVATAVTDASGNYSFSDIRPGKFFVDFDETSAALRGKGFTQSHVGSNTAVDSDVVNPGAGWTSELTLNSGDTVQHIDAGARPSAVTGRLWHDANLDGQQNSGEAGLGGVQVALYATDAAGNAINRLVATTTTGADGTYSFGNVPTGRYFVDVNESQLPSGYRLSAGGDSSLRDNSNSGWSKPFDFTAGQTMILNASARTGGVTVSGHLADQQNGNYALVNCLVQLYVKDSRGEYAIASTRADAHGDYAFKGVITEPGNYYVKFNADGSYGGSNAGKAVMWDTHNSGSSDSVGGDGWRVGWGSVFTVTQFAINNTSETVVRADGTMYRSSPIAIDLNDDGHINTVGVDYGSEHRFDLLGTGDKVHSGWLAKGDGFLVIDTNHNGQIDSVHEMFGGAIGQGFATLARYDSNGDGYINIHDKDFGAFKVWVDANGDRITEPGELKTLAEVGIVALKVSYEIDPSNDGHGNVVIEKSTAILANGHELLMGDVYFQVDSGTLSVTNLAALAESSAASAAHVATLGAAEQAAIQQGIADAAAGRATEGDAHPAAQTPPHGSLHLADLLPAAGEGHLDFSKLLPAGPGAEGNPAIRDTAAPAPGESSPHAALTPALDADQLVLAELTRLGQHLKAEQQHA